METAANLLERSTTQTWETLSTEQLQPLAEAAKEELGSELWKVSLEVQDVPPEKLDPPQLQSRTIRAVVEHSTNRLLRAELTTIRHHITGAKP